MSAEPLQQAYRLIREGKKSEAVRLLVPIARSEPRNANAWWLLANALEDPDKQRRAVERVLLLRPDDTRARKLLDHLQPPLDDPFAEVDFDSFDASAPVSVEPADDEDEFPPKAALAGAPVSAEPADEDDEFPPKAALAGAPISG